MPSEPLCFFWSFSFKVQHFAYPLRQYPHNCRCWMYFSKPVRFFSALSGDFTKPVQGAILRPNLFLAFYNGCFAGKLRCESAESLLPLFPPSGTTCPNTIKIIFFVEGTFYFLKHLYWKLIYKNLLQKNRGFFEFQRKKILGRFFGLSKKKKKKKRGFFFF